MPEIHSIPTYPTFICTILPKVNKQRPLFQVMVPLVDLCHHPTDPKLLGAKEREEVGQKVPGLDQNDSLVRFIYCLSVCRPCLRSFNASQLIRGLVSMVVNAANMRILVKMCSFYLYLLIDKNNKGVQNLT